MSSIQLRQIQRKLVMQSMLVLKIGEQMTLVAGLDDGPRKSRANYGIIECLALSLAIWQGVVLAVKLLYCFAGIAWYL